MRLARCISQVLFYRFLYAGMLLTGVKLLADALPQIKSQAGLLFPVQALSTVFRGKFMAVLAAAHKGGQIERDPQGAQAQWSQRHKPLHKYDWVELQMPALNP